MAYVVLTISNSHLKGCGFAFTIGRGTEIGKWHYTTFHPHFELINFSPSVVSCIQSLGALVKGKSLKEIFEDFGTFWRSLTCDTQFRWV